MYQPAKSFPININAPRRFGQNFLQNRLSRPCSVVKFYSNSRYQKFSLSKRAVFRFRCDSLAFGCCLDFKSKQLQEEFERSIDSLINNEVTIEGCRLRRKNKHSSVTRNAKWRYLKWLSIHTNCTMIFMHEKISFSFRIKISIGQIKLCRYFAGEFIGPFMSSIVIAKIYL